MKYTVKVLVTLCIMSSFFITSVIPAYGWDINDEITKANNYLKNVFGYNGYYIEYTKIKTTDNQIKRYEINTKYVTDGLAVFHNKPLFLYGEPKESTEEYFEGKGSSSPAGKYSALNDEWRTLGFTMEACPFPNPWFPNDFYVVNGREVINNNDKFKVEKIPINLDEEYRDDSGRYWIKNPYILYADGKDIRGLSRAMPDGKSGTISQKTIDVGTAKMINSWVRTQNFRPDYMLNDRKLLSKLVVNPPKSVKDNFEDYLAVLSPPTDNSWGIGVAFYYKWVDNGLTSRYSIFYLKPKSLLKNDLYAQFEYEPSYSALDKIKPGDKVKLGVSIDSLSKIDLKGVGYKIKITKDNGGAIPYETELPTDIVMSGDKMDIPARWTKFYISFAMPESPVNIEFSINEDGKSPEEDVLSNNKITTRFLPLKVWAFDLKYNILTRKVKSPLEDFDIVAQLNLPKGSWAGNATGALGITNATADLLRDFSVKNNPEVNEASSTIARNPQIHTTYYRTDFGDNPQNDKWLNWSTPSQPKIRFGTVNYSGSVSRPYEYTNYCAEEDCGGHTGHDSATANFFSSNSTFKVGAFIYNGMKTITPKKYKNQIDLNNKTSWKKNLFWTSEPYEFNVIRMMYNMDENNTLSAPVRINGQYKRTFTNQNSADSEWKITSSLKDSYKKSSIEKGALATDKAHSGVDFPIRSGYYFNPAGAYTFKITTVTYKPGKGSTQDHTDLVQAFINAFRYETNLVYKDKNNLPMYLNNQLALLSGKGYVGQPAVLSVNSVGLDGRKWMEVEYNKNSTTYYTKGQPEVIEFPKAIDERTNDNLSVTTDKAADAKTDARWKNILEGYTESGTLGSFNSYKYREYVNDKQDKNKEGMYKITETSTVTIKVNPANIKAYTHDRMADGDYYVKVWIADIPFAGHTNNAYKVLPSLQGISMLDRIDIKVVGSKSDDIRFSNR